MARTALHVVRQSFDRMWCSISRLYMQGSCINKRENDFSTNPDCSKDGGAVTDASLASCEKVFASSALLDAPHCQQAFLLSSAGASCTCTAFCMYSSQTCPVCGRRAQGHLQAALRCWRGGRHV